MLIAISFASLIFGVVGYNFIIGLFANQIKFFEQLISLSLYFVNPS